MRIDWGYLYLAAPNQNGLQSALVSRSDAQASWARSGALPTRDAMVTATAPVAADAPVAALSFNVGKVGAAPDSRPPGGRCEAIGRSDQVSVRFRDPPRRHDRAVVAIATLCPTDDCSNIGGNLSGVALGGVSDRCRG